jgi:Leucine-rich repeat (LRR) protein
MNFYINKIIYMLSLVGRELKQLKEKDIANATEIQHLDLSSNMLSSGVELRPFTCLATLIIDDNIFSTLEDFPSFKNLETFSANKNNFSDLSLFLNCALDKFGLLKNLSLLKNPLNPFFEGEEKYNIYRDQVLIKL